MPQVFYGLIFNLPIIDKITVMLKRIFKWIWRVILLTGSAALLGLLLPRLITSLYAMNKIHLAEDAPSERVAIIFGAGLRRDGRPTAVLRDRVETGTRLYFEGKVEKLLMSGDNQVVGYNEPEAMRQYAIELDVPEQDIILDYAGQRTYDTCFRAKSIFGVEGALLVTQEFHLPRALFICNALGIKAQGVEANNFNYSRRSLVFWNIREQFATFTAFMDLYVDNPTLILGQPEPIFVD